MSTNYEKRVASLKALAPPDPAKYTPDPAYAKALISATGMTLSDISAKVGLASSTLRNYTSGRTTMSYPDQYLIETVVAITKDEQTCTPDSNPKPQK